MHRSMVSMAAVAAMGLVAAGVGATAGPGAAAAAAAAGGRPGLGGVGGDAQTAGGGVPQVTVVATGAGLGFTRPDDLARLGSDLFVAFQNGLGPMGQPAPDGITTSAVVGYGPGGVVRWVWRLAGHVDGLGSDPVHHRLLATVNEDGNSAFYSITPGAPAGGQVARYGYNQDPLPHGGGTDAVSVVGGNILVSASSPSPAPADVPAVYRVTLGDGVATLHPLFSDTAPAVVANVGAGEGRTVSLALTDPDSNEVVPRWASRFGGDFVLDSQGDQQQVYVSDAGGPRQQLSLLDLSTSINDTAWIGARGGTLYVTDTGADQVLAVRGLGAGQAIVAATPSSANVPGSGPNYLGVLDAYTGQVQPLPGTASVQPQGLLYVGASTSGAPGRRDGGWRSKPGDAGDGSGSGGTVASSGIGGSGHG